MLQIQQPVTGIELTKLELAEVHMDLRALHQQGEVMRPGYNPGALRLTISVSTHDIRSLFLDGTSLFEERSTGRNKI